MMIRTVSSFMPEDLLKIAVGMPGKKKMKRICLLP